AAVGLADAHVIDLHRLRCGLKRKAQQSPLFDAGVGLHAYAAGLLAGEIAVSKTIIGSAYQQRIIVCLYLSLVREKKASKKDLVLLSTRNYNSLRALF